MDNLLFYSLLILIAYYFLVYSKPTRPDPSATSPKPTQSRSTQTEPITSERTTLKGPDAVKCPSPEVISNQTLSSEDQTLLENTLDQLIKGMNDLNKEIDKM